MKIKKIFIVFILLQVIFNFNCTKVENILVPANSTPSSPRNLTISTDSNLITGEIKVKLGWTSPSTTGSSPITQYIVYKGSSPNSFAIYTYTDADSLFTIDSSVIKDSIYYYAVSAKNELGESPKSNVVNITPSIYKYYPSEPTNLTCLFGNNVVLIDWGVPITNGGSAIINYKIYKSNDSSNLVLYKTLSSSNLSYIDSSVNNSEQYYYQMSASNHLYEGVHTSIVHASQSQGIMFVMSGAVDPNNPSNYNFGFKPSIDVKIATLIAGLPAQPFFDTIINNTPNYIFTGGTTYNFGPYTGVQTGQMWTFKFTGTKVINNQSYIVTSNFIIP